MWNITNLLKCVAFLQLTDALDPFQWLEMSLKRHWTQ